MSHHPDVGQDRLLDPKAHADGAVDGIWREMRAELPVCYHPAGDYPAFWSVTRYDDVKTVYSSPQRFSSAYGVLLRPAERGEDPGAGLTLALTDPPRHHDLRSMLAPRFDQRCARDLATHLRADVRAVLSAVADGAEFDFAHQVAGRLSSLLIARLIGVPEPDLDTIVGWIEEAFAAGKPMTSHLSLTRYVIDLMDQREEEPLDDAVSRLLEGRIDSELLTETEVLLNCENLLGASENAGLSMAAGMAAFLAHPDQWRDMVANRDLLPSAVEEILRWGSSATHSVRTITADSTLGGHDIPAGDRIVVWVRSANQDESEFAQPERLDVRRKPNHHLALGYGEHVCIGQTMARHQLRILLEEMATTVRSFEQVGWIEPLASIAVNGPARLPMRMTLR